MHPPQPPAAAATPPAAPHAAAKACMGAALPYLDPCPSGRPARGARTMTLVDVPGIAKVPVSDQPHAAERLHGRRPTLT